MTLTKKTVHIWRPISWRQFLCGLGFHKVEVFSTLPPDLPLFCERCARDCGTVEELSR